VTQSWEYINRSQTHECGNWDWGRAIFRKEIHKCDFRSSVDSDPVPVIVEDEFEASKLYPWLSYSICQLYTTVQQKRIYSIVRLTADGFSPALIWIFIFLEKLWILNWVRGTGGGRQAESPPNPQSEYHLLNHSTVQYVHFVLCSQKNILLHGKIWRSLPVNQF
jgi:hypothetical protein